MKSRLIALAAAGLVSAALGFGGAEAASVMTGVGKAPAVSGAQNQNIVLAKHWHHHHSGVSIGLGFPFFAPFGYRPYYDDYYYGGYYGGYYPYASYAVPSGSRHVRWCLNHYRTYSVRTNTFVGYDGDLHRCRSPYRY